MAGAFQGSQEAGAFAASGDGVDGVGVVDPVSAIALGLYPAASKRGEADPAMLAGHDLRWDQ